MMIQKQENSANAITFASAESKGPHEMPSKLNEINFARSLRPIYQFSRAFGLMPYTITCDENINFKGVRVRPFDILWCIISISLCITMAVVYYQNIELTNDPNVSIVLQIGDAMLLGVVLIYACTIIILDMINRFKLIKILKSLNCFDNTVRMNCFYLLNIFYCNFKSEKLISHQTDAKIGC